MIHPELPYNLEAEQATLGALIANREAIVMIAPWFKAEMCYQERHQQIYTAILNLFNRRTPPDIRTVSDELTRTNLLDEVGGITYLADLTNAMGSSYHVEYYAREVERCAVNRQLIYAGGKIAAIGYQNGELDEALGSAQQELAKITSHSAAEGLMSFSTLADRQYEWLHSGIVSGVPTHFRDLDEYTGGLHDSDFIILAARPSVGKTALLLGMGYNIAQDQERDVLIFSLEMSRDQLMQRAAAMEAGIDLMRLRMMKLNEAEADCYMATLGSLAALPVFVDDTGAQSSAAIRAKASRHLAQRGRPLIVCIDYLQLMSAPGVKADNRVEAVSSISRNLKALAKELNCPVVALSQLSRGVEGRQSHIPMLSDLRESGGIEQDADIVLFIYREELYDKDTDKKGIAELHIAKHRNGPLGVLPMRFDAATTKFSDLTYRTPEGY
jgi:replicative DNA helicase